MKSVNSLTFCVQFTFLFIHSLLQHVLTLLSLIVRKYLLLWWYVFLCFGSYSLPSNVVFKIKIGSNALMKLRSENLWKLQTEFDLMRLQLIICHKKELLFSLFYKTRASTQQVLPVQTGLYRYDE